MTHTSHVSRRTFLRSSAAFAAAATAIPWRPLFADEPAQPAKELLIHSAAPLNAEPKLADLVMHELTAVKHFYIRNHGPVPKVDEKAHRLRIEGLVDQPLSLAAGELQEKFALRESEATLTCAGNRRKEMSAIKPTSGVQWEAGAIGHARWAGASLADVLKAAGLKPEAKHVWFEGLDAITEKDGSVGPFGGSIPLAKLWEPGCPALIAWKMNDEQLTVEHGFPLRTVVPGYIGARSVKWLTKITVSDRPSPNHYVAQAYKVIHTDDKAELAAAQPIYEFPVNSAICSPADGTKLQPGGMMIAGYALPSGAAETEIEKVEVSTDGGAGWTTALLSTKACAVSWRLWTARVALAPGNYELAVRATDSRGNTQPETCDWNLKGYLYNGWHRVRVEVV